jgi:hypothetical protein
LKNIFNFSFDENIRSHGKTEYGYAWKQTLLMPLLENNASFIRNNCVKGHESLQPHETLGIYTWYIPGIKCVEDSNTEIKLYEFKNK